MYELVKRLADIAGPTGAEQPVQDVVEQIWREDGHAVEKTPLGNLIARVGGKGRRLVVIAHADEIAVVVRAITDGGHCLLMGGGQRILPPNPMLLGQPMTVITRQGAVPAVLGARTGHLRSSLPPDAQIGWGDLFLDLGVESKAEAEELGVYPGCPVCFDVRTRRLGRRIVGKAMDDRAALAVATRLGQLARGRALGCELFLASTVQEENGMNGAFALSASGTTFDAAIALDVGLCGDVPGVGLELMPVRLGAGPVLVHRDSYVRYHRGLSDAIAATAARAQIKLQDAAFEGYGSDAAPMQKGNLPAALLCYPTRYTHSAIEMVDERDLEALAQLLCAFAQEAAF